MERYMDPCPCPGGENARRKWTPPSFFSVGTGWPGRQATPPFLQPHANELSAVRSSGATFSLSRRRKEKKLDPGTPEMVGSAQLPLVV